MSAPEKRSIPNRALKEKQSAKYLFTKVTGEAVCGDNSLKITTRISITRPRCKEIGDTHDRSFAEAPRTFTETLICLLFYKYFGGMEKPLLVMPGTPIQILLQRLTLFWDMPAVLLQEYNLYRSSHAQTGRICRLQIIVFDFSSFLVKTHIFSSQAETLTLPV